MHRCPFAARKRAQRRAGYDQQRRQIEERIFGRGAGDRKFRRLRVQATQRAGRKGQFQPGWRGRVEGHIRAERSRDCRRRIGRVAVDLPSVGMGEPHRIEEREGFRVTRPMQAILDLQRLQKATPAEGR
jgi:hypothetical protein